MLVFKTDLKRLAAEVKTPADALPCHLSGVLVAKGRKPTLSL